MSLFPSGLPDLSSRLETEEWMDDFSITDERLTRAVRDLRKVNRLLGGYAATDAVLDPLFRRSDDLSILDVGCGSGDYLVHLVRRADQFGCRATLIGLDANPATVGHARAHLDDHLSPILRSRVRVQVGDAQSLSVADDWVDIVHAALVLHHFHGAEAVHLLSEMHRVSQHGLLINDLHRHLLAYTGIWLLSRLLRMAPMVQHDAPISVRRGFHRHELEELARQAQLPSPSIQWHWAFRWTLSTISTVG